MKTSLNLALVTSFIVSVTAFSQSADVKVKDIDSSESTAIFIEKNPHRSETIRPPDYEIVDGGDEIVGDPENMESSARRNWKNACSEWKKEVKDLNKENSIISLNCGSPLKEKESYNISFKSKGTYKLKVRIRDTKSITSSPGKK